ncbi:putative hydroxypyruvate isomerase [Octopus sinensis]|uniref:Putative hydroxypyruvate isomerase n=1 Tax=Octopus sinensis TaxID=2607531 RepID=A0A6P7SP68_9MOLL|nr:putative hydroxypyruvate isomerase [Octopus sinensis]
MSKLRLAANLSMLFTDLPNLSDRFLAAKEAGFRYTECAFPYSEDISVLKAAKEKSGVEHVLINSWPGDLASGQLGIAALTNERKTFRDKLELTIEYAKALDCKRVHIMAAKLPKYSDSAVEETFTDNLQYAADRLMKENIMGLIEPINSRLSVPKYFLDNLHKALKYVQELNHPNLKLQFDFFHVQIMDGNLTANFKDFLPYIGHIQISQVPNRGEPNTDGEINYNYIFKMLQSSNYDGYIGLEYNPVGNTRDGLSWIQQMGLQL